MQAFAQAGYWLALSLHGGSIWAAVADAAPPQAGEGQHVEVCLAAGFLVVVWQAQRLFLRRVILNTHAFISPADIRYILELL
jgi:hypothetical protein